jgi:hypothetical protein
MKNTNYHEQFMNFVGDSIGDRVDDLETSFEVVPEHKKCIIEISELLKTVKLSLPKEVIPVLIDYSDKYSQFIGMKETYYYIHGLMDAISICVFLKWKIWILKNYIQY